MSQQLTLNLKLGQMQKKRKRKNSFIPGNNFSKVEFENSWCQLFFC
jgi:hypothetical protein